MVVVFSRVLTSLIDLITAVVIIRVLSTTDFAIVAYLLLIYEVARNLATLGFPESIFYFFEHLTKNFRKAFALQTVGILTLTGILAGGMIMLVKVFAESLISQFDPMVIANIQEYLPLIAIIAVLEIPTWPVHNVLLASDRQKDAGWYQVITSLMSFSALVIPLWLGYPIHIALYSMIGYAAIRLLGSAIWMFLVLPKGSFNTPKGNLKDQIAFSIPLGLSALVSQINKNIDKFIVAFFLSEIAYANYEIGAKEVPIIRVIPFAVGSVLISRYVQYKIKHKSEDLLELWHKGIRKVSILVIPLTLFFIVIAPNFISFLFETEGTDYQNAVLPFQIYNLIILIRVAHYGSILQAYGDTKGILRLSIQLVVLNVILSIPFTIWFGIIGTASATLIANIINWLLTLRRIGGHIEIPFYRVLPIKHYSKVIGISLGVSSIIYYGNQAFSAGFSDLNIILISFAIFAALYLGLGRLVNVIKRDDVKNLRDFFSLRYLFK